MRDIQDERLASLRSRFTAIRVKPDDKLEEVVKIVLEDPECYDVCVVDDDDRLVGVISISRLFQAIFFHYVDTHLMTRHLIELSNCESASELMLTDPVVATESESVGGAIGKMVQHELSELPIVDAEGRLVGSISMSVILQIWLDR